MLVGAVAADLVRYHDAVVVHGDAAVVDAAAEDGGVDAAAAGQRVVARHALGRVGEDRADDLIVAPVGIDQGEGDQPRRDGIRGVVGSGTGGRSGDHAARETTGRR